jgi:hypothetical protein
MVVAEHAHPPRALRHQDRGAAPRMKRPRRAIVKRQLEAIDPAPELLQQIVHETQGKSTAEVVGECNRVVM